MGTTVEVGESVTSQKHPKCSLLGVAVTANGPKIGA